MGLILIALVSASIFSIDGIGEDRGIFRTPFADVHQMARIEFGLRPEFTILNQGGDFRGIFWTNPFNFALSVPVAKGFAVGAGNLARFNQSYDVYFEEDDLKMHLDGKGGVEEVYANIGNDFGIGEIAFRGSYLFGNGSEIWDYYIGDHCLTDTFLYKYSGRIFAGGIKLKFASLFDISLSYEGLGSLLMEKPDSDTTIDLPSRLSVGLYPAHTIFGGKVNLAFEHSFWKTDDEKYRSPSRFRIGFIRHNGFGIAYTLNPWYLKSVTEHGISISLNAPIGQLGSIVLNLGCSLKNKDSLREFNIAPEIKLVIHELFALRRK